MRATDSHCASCGAVEDLYHILFSCDEYRDFRLTLFTSVILASRPHTIMDDRIFPTGTEHQRAPTFRSLEEFYNDTGLNFRLLS